MATETIRLRLHVLAPVHIGCGEVYEPTGFVIDERLQRLRVFDEFAFVKSLPEDRRKRFGDICMTGTPLEVFKFVREHYLPDKVPPKRTVEIVPGLVETYRRVLAMDKFDKRAVINNFLLNRAAFVPGTNEPYIPGTSLKGAIRTALLSKIARENKPPVTAWRDRASQLEDHLLQREGRNRFVSDPFRMVKLSDFHAVGKVSTRIVYAINRKKAPTNRPAREQTGPQQLFEVIQPGAVFEGTLSIMAPLTGAGIRQPIDRLKLFEALNSFFNTKLEQEIKVLKGIGGNPQIINVINRDFRGKLTKTAWLSRLGRHSGAECLTIDGCRRIKIMQGPGRTPRYEQQATTVWLSADYPRPNDLKTSEPFGWVLLEIV